MLLGEKDGVRKFESVLLRGGTYKETRVQISLLTRLPPPPRHPPPPLSILAELSVSLYSPPLLRKP